MGAWAWRGLRRCERSGGPASHTGRARWRARLGSLLATPVIGASRCWQRKRCSLVRWRSRADAQHSARNAARFRVSSTFPDDGNGPADGDRARRFRGRRPRRRAARRTGAGWSWCWCRRSTTTSCATRWRASRASWRRRRSRRSRRRSTPTATSWRRSKAAGNDQAATAAFAIVRDRDPGSGRVTIWVSNRVSGMTTMQRMQVEGGNVDRAAARLAVETVELVRASLAELWPSPAAVDARRPRSSSSRRRRAPARLALAVGVGLLSDFGDAPDFWAPQIAAVVRPARRPRRARRRRAASGPAPDVSTDMGSARIRRARC